MVYLSSFRSEISGSTASHGQVLLREYRRVRLEKLSETLGRVQELRGWASQGQWCRSSVRFLGGHGRYIELCVVYIWFMCGLCMVVWFVVDLSNIGFWCIVTICYSNS